MSPAPVTVKRLAFGVALLGALAASAYVLPGGAILRRMLETREEQGISNVRADGTYLFSGPALQAAASALGQSTERADVVGDGALFLKATGRCRAEVGSSEGGRSSVVVAGGRRRATGAELPVLGVLVEQLCPLLATRPSADTDVRQALDQHLRTTLGIEARTTWLARFGGEVAYVLGNPAEGAPQFWVYKDSFRPARVRFKDKAGVAWDVRLTDYSSSPTGGALPRSIEVWQNGERALRFTSLKGDTRATLPDSLFAAQ